MTQCNTQDNWADMNYGFLGRKVERIQMVFQMQKNILRNVIRAVYRIYKRFF